MADRMFLSHRAESWIGFYLYWSLPAQARDAPASSMSATSRFFNLGSERV